MYPCTPAQSPCLLGYGARLSAHAHLPAHTPCLTCTTPLAGQFGRCVWQRCVHGELGGHARLLQPLPHHRTCAGYTQPAPAARACGSMTVAVVMLCTSLRHQPFLRSASISRHAVPGWCPTESLKCPSASPCMPAEVYPESTVAPYAGFRGVSTSLRVSLVAGCEARALRPASQPACNAHS